MDLEITDHLNPGQLFLHNHFLHYNILMYPYMDFITINHELSAYLNCTYL